MSLRAIDLRLVFTSGGGIRGVSLSADNWKTTVLVGPSGCGKSTLLRCISGLMRPESGRVYVDDQDVSAEAPERRPIAHLTQRPVLLRHRSVRENIAYPILCRERSWKQLLFGGTTVGANRKAEAAASLLGIGHLLDRPPHSLSGGEYQRAGIARVLCREGRVLLLDEPVAGVDVETRATFRRELRQLLKAESVVPRSVVLVTHDREDALDLADVVYVMDRGAIVEVDTPGTLLLRPNRLFTARFFAGPTASVVSAPLVPETGDFATARALGLKFIVFALHPSKASVATVVVDDLVQITSAIGLFSFGKVEALTWTGGAATALVEASSARVWVRLTAGAVVGDSILFAINPARVHVFDPSGDRLEVQATAVDSPG